MHRRLLLPLLAGDVGIIDKSNGAVLHHHHAVGCHLDVLRAVRR